MTTTAKRQRKGPRYAWFEWLDIPHAAHPWPFVSWVLRGGYTEITDRAEPGRERARLVGPPMVRTWRRWSGHRMNLAGAHRITAVEPGTVTLVLVGRRSRDWGFWTSSGWVRDDLYTADCGARSAGQAG